MWSRRADERRGSIAGLAGTLGQLRPTNIQLEGDHHGSGRNGRRADVPTQQVWPPSILLSASTRGSTRPADYANDHRTWCGRATARRYSEKALGPDWSSPA